jgi:hypothetical protein
LTHRNNLKLHQKNILTALLDIVLSLSVKASDLLLLVFKPSLPPLVDHSPNDFLPLRGRKMPLSFRWLMDLLLAVTSLGEPSPTVIKLSGPIKLLLKVCVIATCSF